MAKATIVRAQPVEPPVERVVLELTENEAQVLRAYIFENVWPSSRYGHGSILNAIQSVLADTGLPVQTAYTGTKF